MAAAARLIKSLGAAPDQRAAAYAELTALARGDASDATTGLATATLHVSGLANEVLEDEAKMVERLGSFGTVIAVTLRHEAEQVPWALVTYAEVAESQRALEGAVAEFGLESSMVQRLDTQHALGSTGVMSEATHEQCRRVGISVAAACVVPLVDIVLCADISEVDTEEYQRASLVLASLCLMDREVMAEFFRDGRASATWRATGNAVALMLAKDPADLTRDDAMTMACESAVVGVYHAQGVAGAIASGGEDEVEFLGIVSSLYPLMPGRAPLDEPDLPRRMTLLLLEICRNPRGAPPEAVSGAWIAMGWAIAGRPSVAAALLEAGLLEVAVAQLQKSSAVEWANWRCAPGLQASSAFGCVGILCTLDLPDVRVAQRLVDSGMADAMASLIKAYELRGPSKVDEGTTVGILGVTMAWCLLDLTSAEAQPIVRLLQGMGSALRFTLEYPLVNMEVFGQTTATLCAVVCALAFGREEDSTFTFSQDLVDRAVGGHFKEWLAGTAVQFTPALPAHFLRPLVHLCISDINKAMLVRCDALIPTLLDALFLDPEHVRTNMHETLRAGIQCDGVQCFLQLALFEPGKQLLEQHPEALDALRALVNGAGLTEEARLLASSALAAVEGPLPNRFPAPTPNDEKHVMISYQWNVQSTIRRLVTSLQHRGYVVWFDLECMKGSVVDAMSNAIDNAACMLYGVCEAYKESGNCRLEANYAHQQQLDMLPLMMQEGYNPTGWLGLLLSTRMWYPFYSCEDDDDAAFEKRVDPVAGELGERGRACSAVVSEGVPPRASATRAPAERDSVHGPAPAPTPELAVAPAPALATPRAVAKPIVDRSFTPSIQRSPQAIAMQPQVTGGSFAELTMFVKEQQKLLLEQQTDAKREAQAERAELKQAMEQAKQELEVKIEEQRQRIQQLMAPQEVMLDQQIEALTGRLQSVHASELISDDELFSVEDCIADFLEVKAGCGVVTLQIINTHAAAGTVHKLVVLSEGMVDDGMFARQVRRKFA